MASRKVIVFGPTGAVGSAAARTAQEHGAKVVLAMRDTSKTIPGLDAEKEKQGGFERVQADLTNPETVRDAITSTGAKTAFFYLAFGAPDGMRSTIEAFKSAGIEQVVFLSSYTVRGKDLKDFEPSDIIPYVHAQVELRLEEIYGSEGFVALRPGAFASNYLVEKAGIEKGDVNVFMPEITVDCIVPEDIGIVGGQVLAKGPPNGERILYLFGPQLIKQIDAVRILAKAMGKDPKLETATKEQATKTFEERKLPPVLVNYFLSHMDKDFSGGLQVWGHPLEKEQLSNVQKYSGKKGTTFEEWAEQKVKTFTS